MATATLGSLVLELAADVGRLRGDMAGAVGIVQRGANAMSGALSFLRGALGGALGALGGGAIINAALQRADDLDRLSKQLSLSAENISRLQFVAKQAGFEFDALARPILAFQSNLVDATKGTGAASEALAKLKLSPEGLLGRDPLAQFTTVIAAIEKVRGEAERVNLSEALFGARGAGIIQQLVSVGSAGIQKLIRESDELGATWSTRTVGALDGLGDAFAKVGDAASGAGGRIVADFVGPITAGVEGIARNMRNIEVGIRATVEAGEFLTVGVFGELAKEVESAKILDPQSWIDDFKAIGNAARGAIGYAFSPLLGEERGAQAREGARETFRALGDRLSGAGVATPSIPGPIIKRGGIPVPLGGPPIIEQAGRPIEMRDPGTPETNRILQEILQIQRTRGQISIAG